MSCLHGSVVDCVWRERTSAGHGCLNATASPVKVLDCYYDLYSLSNYEAVQILAIVWSSLLLTVPLRLFVRVRIGIFTHVYAQLNSTAFEQS
jgi:hypothetical protein